MRLTPSDIVNLYRPTPCPLRVYLREKGIPGPSPRIDGRVVHNVLGALEHWAVCRGVQVLESLLGQRTSVHKMYTNQGILGISALLALL
jgi:hypothetical protein